MLSRRFLGSLVPSLAFAAFTLMACGGEQKEVKKPTYEDDDERDHLDGMQVMQEYGGMNEEKVNKTIESLYPSLESCLMKGYERVEFLGGEMAFLVKVNMSGVAEHAQAERSTLGDFQTEQCMLGKLKDSRWPKPVGGRIGLVRSSIAFDPPAEVRSPVEWTENDVASTLAKAEGDLKACGNGGPYLVTAYIRTNGKVLSAGVAHADDGGDDVAACLVGAVQNIKFPSPGSWPAKVTFSL
ncbi:MAG TPA: AgmX/PglI C-terminal domain-containing protein [Polyangiaceae bacterium]|nr:AgmX/PglI C-terminal domain-containing protein [Polyangiaceae bacterium]